MRRKLSRYRSDGWSMRTFAAEVVNGRLKLEDRGLWDRVVSGLKPGRYVVQLETFSEARSIAANKYWWSVCVRAWMDILNPAQIARGGQPLEKEQVHEWLALQLLPSFDGPNGTRLRSTTHDKNSKIFWTLVNAARAKAWDEFGVRIPEPNEDVEVYGYEAAQSWLAGGSWLPKEDGS
jgi:hypothetical protein